MKKLLIGCGVIALLLVGGVSFVAWKLWPAARELMETVETVTTSMQGLNDDYPFDPEVRTDFDTERFADALELRGALRRDFSDFVAEMEALEESDLGVIATASKSIGLMRGTFLGASQRLTDARMGPTEFVHHTLTYWSAARSAHDGLGDQAALSGLRARYEALAEFHEKARVENPELPRLTKLLEPVSPEQTEGARAFLEQHRELGELGEADLVAEMILLQLGNPDPELMQDFGQVRITVDRSEGLPEPDVPPEEAVENR